MSQKNIQRIRKADKWNLDIANNRIILIKNNIRLSIPLSTIVEALTQVAQASAEYQRKAREEIEASKVHKESQLPADAEIIGEATHG